MAGDERHSDPYALPPEVEEERLRSLDQLHIVGTPPEGRFGHITRMARVALGVPMSAINLIDRDLQWCKEFSGDSEPDFMFPGISRSAGRPSRAHTRSLPNPR